MNNANLKTMQHTRLVIDSQKKEAWSDQQLLRELLFVVQHLEMYIGYYFLSEGMLYAEQTAQTTLTFLHLLGLVRVCDKAILLTYGPREHQSDLKGLLQRLKKWATGSPLDFGLFRDRASSISILLMGIKVFLVQKTGIRTVVPIVESSYKWWLTFSAARWGSHFDQTTFMRISPAELFADLSQGECVAMCCDIRRSQDLMIFAASAEDYAGRLEKWLTHSRELVHKHRGIFDKFTGDGFIAYFSARNHNSCEEAIKKFSAFADNLIEYSQTTFEDWRQTLRRLPSETIGLAIGADFGRISFTDVKGQLFAVGEPLVWAERMCRAANAGEIVVNNLLAKELTKIGVKTNSFSTLTKSGDSVLAFRVIRTNVDT